MRPGGESQVRVALSAPEITGANGENSAAVIDHAF
jgi:hypothetical protein